jgi:hypothetical protein
MTYVCGLDAGRCTARHGRCGLVAVTWHFVDRCSDI